MNAQQTVVGMSMSRDSNNRIRFSVDDSHSGDTIIKVDMSLEEFGLMVTGLHGVKGVAGFYPDCNIAKKRETKTVTIDIDKFNTPKETIVGMVHKDFAEKYEPDGWELHSNGTRSQQNVSGKHCYTIKRYEPVENPLEVERFY